MTRPTRDESVRCLHQFCRDDRRRSGLGIVRTSPEALQRLHERSRAEGMFPAPGGYRGLLRGDHPERLLPSRR